MSRRTLLTGSLLAGSPLAGSPLAGSPVARGERAAVDERGGELQRAVADLESRHGGRLGVAVLDTTRTKPIAHRGDERFPLCSTYKLLAAAFVLARVDRRQESLTRRIVYSKQDLVPYSPITAKHVGDGLTVGEICAAAVTLSDNTAGNLLLDSFGGPAALTSYLRSIGDGVTRLDRQEPELNDVGPGDSRDTTSPIAMLETTRKTVLGNALSESSRAQLAAWLVADQVGDKRLRAGMPAGWRVGDKTGSGPRNATNDVAVVWPPAHGSIIVTAYYIDARASDGERNAVMAAVGRLAAAAGT